MKQETLQRGMKSLKEEYFETQRELRLQIERRDREEAHHKLNEMAKEVEQIQTYFGCTRERKKEDEKKKNMV